MHEVAPDVHRIALAPRDAMNAYFVGDVLVDAGTTMSGGRLLSAAKGRPVTAHLITHAHVDHAGSSAKVARELGVPVWAGAPDVPALRAGRPAPPPGRVARLLGRLGGFPAVDVARTVGEGEEVEGFRVLDAPGHTAGHLALWRESDRVLICGDVWFGIDFRTLRPALREPFGFATVDPEQNRRTMRRLAELEPAIACFGHGPVLTDAAPRLRAFVDGLA